MAVSAPNRLLGAFANSIVFKPRIVFAVSIVFAPGIFIASVLEAVTALLLSFRVGSRRVTLEIEDSTGTRV